MSSSSVKPVVVLVHGTMHRPIHFLPFILRLRKEGFTVVAPANASSGWDDSTAEKTLKDDVAVIKAAIQPHLDAGRELIFVGHSYGSLPATDCIVGNSIEERKAKGLPGGVKAILSIAAIVPLKAGLGIMDQIGLVPGGSGHYDPPPKWWAIEGAYTNCVPSEHPEQYLYSDIDPDVAAVLATGLVKQSTATFAGINEYSYDDAKVPKTYVICENDKTVHPEIQEGMARMSGSKVVRLQCGHTPFLKEKETEVLVDILNGF